MTMLRPLSIPNLIAGGLSTSRALYIASRSICYTADGAYDRDPTYDAVLRHNPKARIVIPPRSNAVARTDTAASSQRDDHIASMPTGDGKRALVETAMGRYKRIIARRLRARSFPGSANRGHYRPRCS
jgi:hypothetical protein